VAPHEGGAGVRHGPASKPTPSGNALAPGQAVVPKWEARAEQPCPG